MSQLCLALSTLFILWSPLTAIPQANFSGTDAFLKSTLQGEDQLSNEARGDLNGDGLEDWAGVINRRRTASAPTYQLYMLLRLRRGGYQVAERSREQEISGAGCCWVERLEIRRSSIYIQNNAKTANTMEAATHQFKLYKGEWRLVGMKIYYTDFNPDPSVTITTEMNLLTGAVIEERQSGDNKPVTRNRRRRFASYLLKDFDFSSAFGLPS